MSFGGMLRDDHQISRWDRAPIAAVLLLTLLAPGCSGSGGVGTPAATASDPSAPPSASSSPTLREKLSNLFSGSSARSPQAVANAGPDVSCPFIDIRQGASTLTVGPTGDNAAMGLKYQGTFVRAARDCAVVNGQIVMNIGVEGRIVVGPAGGPGQVNVPLRIAVVQENVKGSKTIVTKLIRIPVTVQSNTDNPLFTHIEEGLTFPMPAGGDLDDYTVYIGFDPLAADAQDKEKSKPKARPRGKPKPKPTASTD
jgi:hypothetical protein